MSKIIKDEILTSHLKSDVKLIGLPTDFELEFRGYSKSYCGRYYIKEQRIVIYILDEYNEVIPYHEILDTVIHEAIHHYQHHHDPNYIRFKGVMHDVKFNNMYSQKMNLLRDLEVIPSA